MHEPSWEICTNISVEKTGWSRMGAVGGSDLDAVSRFLYLLGLLCLSHFALVCLVGD